MNTTSQPAFRPPNAYVHGVDSPVVVVPARVAAWLERRAGLSSLRPQVRGADPEVDAVLVALRLAAMTWTSSVGGTETRNQPELEASSELTTQQVADAFGLTSRAVRKAIAAGRLKAHQVGARWVVTREDFEHYKAARAAA